MAYSLRPSMRYHHASPVQYERTGLFQITKKCLCYRKRTILEHTCVDTGHWSLLEYFSTPDFLSCTLFLSQLREIELWLEPFHKVGLLRLTIFTLKIYIIVSITRDDFLSGAQPYSDPVGDQAFKEVMFSLRFDAR